MPTRLQTDQKRQMPDVAGGGVASDGNGEAFVTDTRLSSARFSSVRSRVGIVCFGPCCLISAVTGYRPALSTGHTRHQRVRLPGDVQQRQAAGIRHLRRLTLPWLRVDAGRSGSGVQPAIARACSRALALSWMPGNRRRSSMAADSSPSRS